MLWFKLFLLSIICRWAQTLYHYDWTVTVGNISSTAAIVSWLPLNSSSSLNSTDIHGYVVLFLRNDTNILKLNLESASSSNTVVRNLRPYTRYKVKVVALVRDGDTGVTALKSRDKLDIRTQEDVPGYVPRLNARNGSSNSLEIEWSPIPEKDTHGVLLGYVVYFRPYRSYEDFTTVKVNASTRVLRITGLLEATKYVIKVAGRTSVGEGPLRTRDDFTACGRTFTGTTGEINVTSSYFSALCDWEIHSPLMNSRILLVVKRFQTRACSGSVATRSGQSMTFCGQKEPFAFLISGGYAKVRLALYNDYYYGTTLKAFYVVMNNTGSDGSYQRGWNVTVGNISSTAAIVSWLSLNSSSSLNSTDIHGYVVLFLRNRTNILKLNLESASSSNTVVRNLRPYTKYKVKVVALVRDEDTGVTALKSSDETDIRTQEDVPGYVPWVNGRNRGFNSLEITWSPIPEEDTHGVLLGYIVYFRPYRSYEDFTTVKVNASTRVLRITGLLKATKYVIKVAGRTSVGEGPLRTGDDYTACGRSFTGTTGEINVTSSYFSASCDWEIHSPSMNSRILLVVNRFQTRRCSGSVATRSGQNMLFCGQKEPFAFLISGGYAKVRLALYNDYYDGTTLKAFYVVMNNTGSDASYQRGWNVTVGNISSTAAIVSWLPLNSSSSLNSTDIYGYVVLFLRNDTNLLKLNLESASSSNTVVRNLRPYTRYKVKVVALVRDGDTGITALKSSDETDIGTPEDVPGYVPWVNGRNRGSNSLEITWSPIPEEDTHGVLLGYVVYFRPYRSYEDFTTVKVNASTRVLRITGLLEATKYVIKVAGRTSVGEGPFRTRDHYTSLLLTAVFIKNFWF